MYERRYFLKNFSLGFIAISINPFESIITNKLNDFIIFPDDSFIEFNPSIRQLDNYCRISNFSDDELKTQYNGLIQILSKANEPGFENLTKQQKVETIQNIDPFRSNSKASKEQIKELYKGLMLTGAVGLGIFYITKGKIGVLTTLTGTVLNLSPWMVRGGKVIDGLATIHSGYKIVKDNITSHAIYSAEELKINVFDQYLNSGNFQFESTFSDLKLNISKDKGPINESLNTNQINNPIAADLINWIKTEIKDKSIFTSKEDLEIFLDKYITKIGDLQQSSLKKVIEEHENGRNQQALVERDNMALCQSIHGFIGLAISNIAGEKEAEVLNTLIGAGFQFALTGMTPIGWCAIGINIATTLFKKSPDHAFEKAVLKALQQIQKQLNFIIERINLLHQNQIEILKQLNDILKKLDNLTDLVTDEFANLNDKADLIYNQIRTIGLDAIENDFQSAENNLKDAYNNNNWSSYYTSLQQMRNIATTRLNDNIITKYNLGSFKAEILKKQLLFDSQFKYNISLYDSIGLLSAFHSYNPNNDRGTCNIKLLHPIEYNTAVNSIVSWLIISDLSNNEKRSLAQQLLPPALQTSNEFKQIAQNTTIEQKSSIYIGIAENVLFQLYSFLSEQEKKETTSQTNLLKNFTLKTIDQRILENFTDRSIKDLNNPQDFLLNDNDNSLYNLARDMGLIEKITTQSQKTPIISMISNRQFVNNEPQSPNQYFPGFNVNDAIGMKKNTILFDRVLLDYNKRIWISFRMTYLVEMKLKEYEVNKTRERGCGHDGNNDCFYLNRTLKKSIVELKIDPLWKEEVKEKCIQQDIDISNLIPDFDNITFDTFLKHLIYQGFRNIKEKITNEGAKLLNQAQFSNFDGIGLSLMNLSKLNQLITAEIPIPYVLDYSDELYIREDIIDAIGNILHIDFSNDGKNLLERLMNLYVQDQGVDKQNSIFYLKKNGSTYTEKLNPQKFVDLVLILLKEMVLNTIKASLDRTKPIGELDCEPFMKESIAKLNWYLDTQI